ncbi:MAG: radical SAM protein [Anaerolineales bacterium]|jgi:organic radical activating enzyme
MTSILNRWFPKSEKIAPPKPGVYHHQATDDAPIPFRLHLRVEADGTGILIVNAATVLHLNPSATAHALHLVQDTPAEEAASDIATRYRVRLSRARKDYETLRARILTLATNPDVDPVLYLGLERTKPYQATPSAPYRLDLALTYTTDPSGEVDPLARERADRELETDEWKRVLDTAWEVGIPHVTFTGGEPTRRKDLVDLVTYAEELGLVTGVLTCGDRLADRNYTESLSQAGLDHFLIVLNPDSPDCLKGIQHALDGEVFTAVHLTVSEALSVVEWLEKLHEMGAMAVSLSAPDTSAEMASRLEDARQRAADLGLSLVWDLPVPYSHINPIHLELGTQLSGAGRVWLYVEPDGDVLPQQGVERILGNILTDSWPQIWSSALAD